jgi:hypothetical protein
MQKATIYRFEIYDIANDEWHRSRRWGTREAIERIRGAVIESTATEVDASAIASDIAGLTMRDFNPAPANKGFQAEVRR